MAETTESRTREVTSTPITLPAKRRRGVRVSTHLNRVHVDVDTPIGGPSLARLEEVPPDERYHPGLTLHRLDLRPSAELSAEVHVRLDGMALTALRDLIDDHLTEERRRTDGLRYTTVR